MPSKSYLFRTDRLWQWGGKDGPKENQENKSQNDDK